MLDDRKLAAALWDLAEFGTIIVDTIQDARQVVDASPVRTRIRSGVRIGADSEVRGSRYYTVEEVKDVEQSIRAV